MAAQTFEMASNHLNRNYKFSTALSILPTITKIPFAFIREQLFTVNGSQTARTFEPNLRFSGSQSKFSGFLPNSKNLCLPAIDLTVKFASEYGRNRSRPAY